MVPGVTGKSMAVIDLGPLLCVESILIVSLSSILGVFYIFNQ